MSEHAAPAPVSSVNEHAVAIDGYDLLGYRAAIGATPSDAHMAVRSVLRGFGPVDVGPGLNLPRYELEGTPTAWQVRVNGAVVQTDADFLTALGTLEWHVITAALKQREDLFLLHGASLCLPTQSAGVVLAGESGNGKTTLTLGLMLRGFVPFGDDIVLLDPATLELQALRRAFHITDETWRLLEPFAGHKVAADDAGPPGYFSPPQWAERRVPVRWMLFPEYQPRQPTRLVPLSPADAAMAILTRSLNLAGAPRRALATASRLTEQAACYRFLTGDVPSAIAAIQQLVAGALLPEG